MQVQLPPVRHEASGAIRRLRTSRMFGGLDAGLLDRLERGATHKALTRGGHVWKAGDEARSFTLICAGLVKLIRSRGNGDEAILGLFGPGEALGTSAVLECARYPAHAVVGSETASILRIDAAPILEVLEHDPKVAHAMMKALMAHSRGLREKLAIMSAGSVPRRLSMLLLHLSERFGDELEDGRTILPVPLRRAELARLVGTTVETAIRVMRKWERQGLIETSDSGFVINDAATFAKLTRGEP